jgi:hypothetical protein
VFESEYSAYVISTRQTINGLVVDRADGFITIGMRVTADNMVREEFVGMIYDFNFFNFY